MASGAPSSSALSFRHALAWAGIAMFAGLCAMGLVLGAALSRADDLLQNVSRAQAQLAAAAHIQAEVNAFVVAPSPAAAAVVRAELQEFRASIVEEGEAAERDTHSREHQVREAARGDLIAALFERIAAAPADVSPAQLTQFRSLTAEVRSSEQAEAATSLAAMERLRLVALMTGIGLPLAIAIVAAVGFTVLSAGVMRPLDRLERATERVGEAPEGELRPVGFAEFRRLAESFNRMSRQIAGQRQALFDANRGLEAQVAQRTGEIEAARQTLVDVDAARRLFIAKVSHELRTPATVVRGEAEVALRDRSADAARLREALEHVVANGAFLQRRLDDLLALARADDGRLRVRREPVDLAVVGREVAVLAESYVRSSDVSLRVALPEGAGPMVQGDASWLQQALLALLDNAAKFAAGAEVRLSLVDEGDAAVFIVADEGPGVAAEDLPHLFDRYYQTARGRDRGGAGLGLSVARWVVEQHGGDISARTGEQGGLVISMRLPTERRA